MFHSYRDHNWFWVPFVGPHVGAMLGVMVYQTLIGVHFPDEEHDLDLPAISAYRETDMGEGLIRIFVITLKDILLQYIVVHFIA